MNPFNIVVTTSGKQYRMTVERKYLTDDMERFEVRAKNHTFLFDCNRQREGIAVANAKGVYRGRVTGSKENVLSFLSKPKNNRH